MKKLEQLQLVQFFLFEAEAFQLNGHCAFIGPNGAGKTSVIDAVQLALMGTNENAIQLNSQKDEGGRDRTIREYCLGKLDETFKRDYATSYITLVFRDEQTDQVVSAGVCIGASVEDPKHEVQGLYVVEGLTISLGDHLESGPAGQSPFPFSSFKSAIEARCRATPGKPRAMFFKEREKSAYVEQLVRSLSGKDWINAKDFMRAFRRSVLLRHQESVDVFVRNFLVEPEAVNKSAAAAQVEDFKRMSALVEATRRKIGDLTELQKHFKEVERLSQQAVSLQGLALSLEVEHLSELNIDDEDKIEALEADIVKADDEVKASQQLVREMDAQLALIQSSMDQDQAQQRRQELQATMKGAGDLLAQLGGSLVYRLKRWEQALQSAKSYPIAEPLREEIEPCIDALQAARQDLQAAEPNVDVIAAADRAVVLLRRLVAMVQAESSRVSARKQAANDAVAAAKAAKDGLDQTGVLLLDEHALGYARLIKEGIKPKPVCSLVSVRNREWQPAIEAYLKGNRFAFVVAQDDESRAVDLLDKGDHGPRIYGVKIVRSRTIPAGYKPALDLVASELEGDPTAVAFLQDQFGNLKKADRRGLDSKEGNGLTPTGGLSRGRATQWLRMPSPNDLAIGRSVADSLAEADRQIKEAEKKQSEVAGNRAKLQELLGMLNLAAGDRADADRFKDDLKQAQEQRGTLVQHQTTMEAIDLGHLQALIEQQQDLTRRKEAASDAALKASVRSGKAEGELTSKRDNLKERKLKLARVLQEEQRFRADQDFDATYCEEKRQKLTEPKDGVVLAHDVLISNIRSSADSKIKRLNDKARPSAQYALTTFLDRYAEYVLFEERSDWRKALHFINTERTILVESTLVQYEQQLQVATRHAEDGFRTGVAVRIRTAIEKMRRHVRDLNNLLSTCTFTNGEVYRFSQTVIPEYKEFVDYFEASGNQDSEFSLFGGPTDIGKRVLELLTETPKDGKPKTDNILDDYRLMFTFDVDILVNGARVTKLSNRIGPGSGGEHRAPFYVIAGAALARAYRTDEGTNRSGVAIMLLDEAFGKMDEQNSIAATEFLERMGLQLVMTAPSADRAKMSAVSDTIFEFLRLGKTINVRPVGITDKGKQLMRSDLPALNPYLVERQLDLVQREIADASARANGA